MFRKSVSFFVLVALLWILLWLYIPDGSPNNFTIGDLFRGFFLLFSLMAFALLMLIIRYNGLDLASKFIPYVGIVTWLGQHAYQFSQPKTTIFIKYTGPSEAMALTLKSMSQSKTIKPTLNQTTTVDLGCVTENLILTWQPQQGFHISHELATKDRLKNFGKILQLNLEINQEKVNDLSQP